MALGGPRARPASRRLSRVAAGVGGKVSCWRRLPSRRRFSPPPTPPCLCFAVCACCVAVWTGFKAAAGANGLWEAGGVVVGGCGWAS